MRIEDVLDFLTPLVPPTVLASFGDEWSAYLENLENLQEASDHAEVDLQDPEVDSTDPESFVSVADMRYLVDRPKQKWYNPRGRTSSKIGICVHHTAVKGGFGVRKSTRREFSKAYTPDHASGRVDAQSSGLHIASILEHNTEVTRAAWVDIQARGARYRGYGRSPGTNAGQPYHAISSRNSTLYLNLPFEWVTWHGNGANTQYLGYAWDGNTLKESVPDPDEIIRDICYIAERMRVEGHRCDVLTTHSVWTNKPHDPGAEFIETVIVPAAKMIGCSLNMDFVGHPRGRSMRETLRGTS